MKKSLAFILIVFSLVAGFMLGYTAGTGTLEKNKEAYYRAVWNTCVYNAVRQVSDNDATQICTEAYDNAIRQNWYSLSGWAPAPRVTW